MLPPWYYFAIAIQIGTIVGHTLHYVLSPRTFPFVMTSTGKKVSAYSNYSAKMLVVTLLVLVFEVFRFTYNVIWG